MVLADPIRPRESKEEVDKSSPWKKLQNLAKLKNNYFWA